MTYPDFEPGRVILYAWVRGHPRTKGSKSGRPNGTVTETKLSLKWAGILEEGLRLALPDGWRPIPRPWLVDGRIVVHVPFDDVTARGAGDGDKHLRQVWDALTRAGLWQDDAQGWGWPVYQVTANDRRGPGVEVWAWVTTGELCLSTSG